MAFESQLVSAEMVEATEFPELSAQFQVSGVPDTVINSGVERVLGAAPEPMLIEKIKTGLAKTKN